MRFGPPDDDEFGGNLGPGAERADADIAARQLLRYDAHRHLAEPHAAVSLGNREPEDAHGRKAGDDFERDVSVGAVPALGVRNDLGVGEAAHLAADRLEGFVKARIADQAFPRLRDQSGEGGAVFPRVAGGDQGLDGLVAKGRDLSRLEAEVGETDDFALIHWDGAKDLGEIFSQPNARQELFSLAESAVLLRTIGIGRHFLDCFDIGRKPRQPVDGVLFGLYPIGAELAVFAHPFAHGG